MNVREAASPDDYWDHSQEQGVAFIPHRLQEISPCWRCFSLYRFNQHQDSSGINRKGPDSEQDYTIGACAEAITIQTTIRAPERVCGGTREVLMCM